MEALSHITLQRSWEDAYKAMVLAQDTWDSFDSTMQDGLDDEDSDQVHRPLIEIHGEK